MSGARLTVTFDDRQLAAGLRRIRQGLQNRRGLLGAIGTGMVANTMHRFDRHVDPQGRGWAPLSPGYQAIKRGPGILQERATSGGLMGSITRQVRGDSVIVGTNKVYGAIYQFGGTITAKNAKGLRFRMAGHWVRVRSVRIPARPYLGFGPEDQQTVRDVLAALLPR